MNPSATISVHPRILAEDILSDHDLSQDLLRYPDQPVTFNNGRHPVWNWLVPTLYKINTELPKSQNMAHQVSVNSPQRGHGFADLELYAQPSDIARHIVLPSLTSFTRT
jgi:hypothetical protein